MGIVPNTSSAAIRTAVKTVGNGGGLSLTDADVTVLVKEQNVDAATAELARSMVYAGRTDALPELEDTLVALGLAVLAGRPWPPGIR